MEIVFRDVGEKADRPLKRKDFGYDREFDVQSDSAFRLRTECHDFFKRRPANPEIRKGKVLAGY